MSIYSRCIQVSFALLMVAGPSYALEFPQTRDRGAPARGPALATRGEVCLDPNLKPSLTSILPHNAIATAFGADVDIPMSLWFYVPQTGAASAELTVVDEMGEEIYQHTVELPANPGTIQLELPRYQSDGETPAFASGNLYYWDFALICDPNDRGDDVLLGGGIQRLDASPAFLAELNTVAEDPLGQAELYAAAGAWQETVTLAAAMRPQNPDAWTQLLVSVDLAAVATQPIVGQDEVVLDTPAAPMPTTPKAGGNSSNLQRLLEGINR